MTLKEDLISTIEKITDISPQVEDAIWELYVVALEDVSDKLIHFLMEIYYIPLSRYPRITKIMRRLRLNKCYYQMETVNS